MKRPSLVWLINLTVLWPLVQVLIFRLRFGRLPPLFPDSLVFAPMGFLSGFFLLALLGRTQNRTTRISAVVGYLVACPIAIVGALGGGLMLPPLLGVTIFGAVPLIAGTAVGYWLGYLVAHDTTKKEDHE